MSNSGPSTDPCGTPEVTCQEEDVAPSQMTVWTLLVKKDFIQDKRFPRSSFINNRRCGTLSKAFQKSNTVELIQQQARTAATVLESKAVAVVVVIVVVAATAAAVIVAADEVVVRAAARAARVVKAVTARLVGPAAAVAGTGVQAAALLVVRATVPTVAIVVVVLASAAKAVVVVVVVGAAAAAAAVVVVVTALALVIVVVVVVKAAEESCNSISSIIEATRAALRAKQQKFWQHQEQNFINMVEQNNLTSLDAEYLDNDKITRYEREISIFLAVQP